MIKSPSITNSMVKKSRKLKSFQRDGKKKTCLFGTDFISKVRVKIPKAKKARHVLRGGVGRIKG